MKEPVRHVIIGTAGHVDHGKTTLIRALTGHDTDRLAEEKARGISIDLGFAPFRLPDGTIAGVVDVPGHEQFISNMLVGIGGIDVVLLVVDVMEGVRPQTREHLQIMQLLDIPRGVLVLNKCDLAAADWIELVEEEVRQEVAGTFLEGAPVCRVSAVTGAGVPELVATVQRVIGCHTARHTSGPLRLPVDRTFTVAGFGTVVSGTLLSGSVSAGDTVEVLPLGRKVRVRGVQVHGTKVVGASAGQRTALNLADVDRDEVPRGSVIGAPGALALTNRFDARLRLLPGARPLEYRDQVHLHLGTARTVATVAILDRETVEAGEEALVQLQLAHPLVAHRRDRFVVRSYSPVVTIGGGVVIDPRPTRHRRFREAVIESLLDLESGHPGFLARKLGALQCATCAELASLAGLTGEEAERQLDALRVAGLAARIGDQWTTPAVMAAWSAQLCEGAAQYHTQNPLLPGVPLATARTALPSNVRGRAWDELLQSIVARGELEVTGDWLRRPGHLPTPTSAQAALLLSIETIYRADGLQINSRALVLERLGISGDTARPLFLHLAATEALVRIDEDTYFHRDAYTRAVHALREHFQTQPTLTLSAFRDRLGAARKHVQALLEHFDSLHYTVRRGDERVPGRLSS